MSATQPVGETLAERAAYLRVRAALAEDRGDNAGADADRQEAHEIRERHLEPSAPVRHTAEPWSIDGEYIVGPDNSPRFRVMGSAPYNREWMERVVSDPAAEIAALRADLAELHEVAAGTHRVAKDLEVERDALRARIAELERDADATAFDISPGMRQAAKMAGLRLALTALTEWGCTHTSPTDANSPHELLVAAREALVRQPPPDNMTVRVELAPITDIKRECDTLRAALIRLATEATHFKNSNRGIQFLETAITEANAALAKGGR